MDWDALVKRLVELAPHRAPSEEELRAALLAAAEGADERELVTVEHPRTGFVETVVGAPCASLVRLWWQPNGPCSSFVGIDLVEATDGGLLVQRDDSDDEMDWQILACLPPPLVPGAVVRHFPALGVRLEKACAPEEITNHAPDLIPMDVVRELAGAALGPAAWHEMDPVEDLLDSLADVATRARVRRYLPRHVRVDEAIARLRVTAQRAPGARSEEEWALVADVWFAIVYEEAETALAPPVARTGAGGTRW